MPDLQETAAKSWQSHTGDTTSRTQPIRDTTSEPVTAVTGNSAEMPSLGEAMEAVENYVKEHPMQVLVGAITVGAIVALAVSNRRPRRSERWMRDIGRTTTEMQRAASREARSLLREVRKSRVGNGLAEDLSSTLSPILSRIVSALGAAKEQAGDAVSSVAKSAGLK